MSDYILTAASEKYFDSLCGLIGSLNANWPEHPEIVVYDIGLGSSQLKTLSDAGIAVRTVPHFSPHWRLHYTWKLWILHEHKLDCVLWLDSGIVVLRPLAEIFAYLKNNPIFVVPNFNSAASEANEHCVRATGLTKAYLSQKSSIAGNIIGLSGDAVSQKIITDAYTLGLTEANLKALASSHRHDQALLTCVIYRHLDTPVFADGQVYAGWGSPRRIPGQRIWAHRRTLMPSDVHTLRTFLRSTGKGFTPLDPETHRSLKSTLILKIKSTLGGKKNKGINNGVR